MKRGYGQGVVELPAGYLSVTQAAAKIGVSRSTIVDAIYDHRLPAFRFVPEGARAEDNNPWWILEGDLERWRLNREAAAETLGARAAARELGIDHALVVRAHQRGDLAAVLVSGKPRFTRAALRAWRSGVNSAIAGPGRPPRG